MALNLMAPHTWPASIMPCLFAICACSLQLGYVNLLIAGCLLAICIAMQASVNVFNDYFDYAKGTDSEEDNLDPDDNVLPYYHVNPTHALALAIGLLLLAFAIGIYLIYCAGFAPLIIALIGAAIVVLYSAGKTPISYLPIGEFVSGFVMGGLIPLGVCSVLMPQLDFFILAKSIPFIIAIGLIMQTNNTCDIEKDKVAQRKTMPCVVGRNTSKKLYNALIIISLLACGVVAALWYTNALWLIVVMYLAIFPIVKGMFKNPLLPQTRIPAMSAVCAFNLVQGAFLCATVLGSTLQLM